MNTLVPSGTGSSCYQEPKSGLSFATQRKSGDSNLANTESNVVEVQRPMWTAPLAAALTCSQAISSNKHFSPSDFTDEATHDGPQASRRDRRGGAREFSDDTGEAA